MIVMVRCALAKCPDEGPSPTTAQLQFIDDTDLRDNIRIDISGANNALHNGEWKGATVLAGSAVEALLLWGIRKVESRAEFPETLEALVSSRVLSRKPHSNIERWNLHEYTEVAFKLELIQNQTAEQVRIVRYFRNLIHPGLAERLEQICDRGTAMSAVAAIEHVARDLG